MPGRNECGMDRLDTLALFVRSVETGSFSAAAREAGTTQSAVSKRIAALEARLGTGLIRRTTRSLSLTEDGRTYYEDCRRILYAVAQSETRIGRQRTSPAGLVRIGSPVSFGRRKIVPRLRRFLEAHPLIQVELLLNDGFVDLVGSGVDVAIRIGALADSTAVARRIGTTRRATVATPDYFDRAGRPAVPADLTRHN